MGLFDFFKNYTILLKYYFTLLITTIDIFLYILFHFLYSIKIIS